jgi:hypothetical protein
MTQTSDRHRRLSAASSERVVAVPADRWGSPSPCEEGTARDVVGHIRDGSAGRELAPGPSPAEDPVGAGTTVRDAVQGVLDDAEIAGAEYGSSPMGCTRFDTSIDQFVNFDLLTHTRDPAGATGLDERLDPVDVHKVFGQVRPMDQLLGAARVGGPHLEPRAEADERTRLLALLGRRA